MSDNLSENSSEVTKTKKQIAFAIQCHREGRLQEAEESYTQLLALDPSNPQLCYLLGLLYFTIGNLERSREFLSQSVELEPQRALAWVDLGNTLRDLGELDDAITAYGEAIVRDPDNALAHCFRAQLQNHALPDACEEEYCELLAAYERSSPNSDQRRDLAWGLARASEQRGEWPRCFELLEEAHKDSPTGQAFDLEKTQSYFESVRAAITPELIAERSSAGSASESPIFLVGMPRSGSSLVEQILASHSKVYGAGELRLVGNLCGQMEQHSGTNFSAAFAKLENKAIASLAEGYLGATQSLAPNAERIVDKMPSNFLALGMLALMLPNAKFVHVRRQPIATCWSIYSTRFGEPHGFASTQENLAGYFCAYSEMMDYWMNLFPDRIFTVEYEALVDDPKPTIDALLDFCGLSFESSCLEFHLTKRPVRTASASQVRQPLYTGAVDRYRNFESMLSPLITRLGGKV